MKRKAINLIIGIVVLLTLIGGGIGAYFYFNQGPAVGHIELGKRYYLSEIHPTDLFPNIAMNDNGYFQIKKDGKTGVLHLIKDDNTPVDIPLIITKYQETNRNTTIEFEYLLFNDKKTKIQHLTAISTKNEIRIKNTESHDVRIIRQDPNDINSLEYAVTILVFKSNQEGA